MTEQRGTVKVINIVTRLNIGGVAHHVTNLMRGLDRAKYDQQLVCGFEGAGEKSMREHIQAQGLTPILIPQLVGNPRLNVFGRHGVRAHSPPASTGTADDTPYPH